MHISYENPILVMRQDTRIEGLAQNMQLTAGVACQDIVLSPWAAKNVHCRFYLFLMQLSWFCAHGQTPVHDISAPRRQGSPCVEGPTSLLLEHMTKSMNWCTLFALGLGQRQGLTMGARLKARHPHARYGPFVSRHVLHGEGLREALARPVCRQGAHGHQHQVIRHHRHRPSPVAG